MKMSVGEKAKLVITSDYGICYWLVSICALHIPYSPPLFRLRGFGRGWRDPA